MSYWMGWPGSLLSLALASPVVLGFQVFNTMPTCSLGLGDTSRSTGKLACLIWSPGFNPQHQRTEHSGGRGRRITYKLKVILNCVASSTHLGMQYSVDNDNNNDDDKQCTFKSMSISECGDLHRQPQHWKA